MTTKQAEQYYRALKTIAKLETVQAKQDLAFSKHIGNGDGVDFFTARITQIARAVDLAENGYITADPAGMIVLTDAGLEIAEPKKATGQAAGTAAETTVSEGAPASEAAATAAPA